jgi:AcrR family transcriptional regulator
VTAKGDRTKAALIAATTTLVAELGYHQTTTKAIAKLAGISEGAIYRHFPDKRSLFFAAVLASHQPVLDWMDGLPARAGAAPLAETLTDCLLHLSELRAAVVPLELALASDPDLAKNPASTLDLATIEAQGGPPHMLARYLHAEQGLGRIRADIDTTQAAIVLLAALFGLSASPLTPPGPLDRALIAGAVKLVLEGITP